MEVDKTNHLLEEILKSLHRIESLLQNTAIQSTMELESVENKGDTVLDVMSLINIVSEIDVNLVPTIKAILSSGGHSSAQEIASKTNRSRSRENQHLNHLVELGYVHKKRDGREIIFYIE